MFAHSSITITAITLVTLHSSSALLSTSRCRNYINTNLPSRVVTIADVGKDDYSILQSCGRIKPLLYGHNYYEHGNDQLTGQLDKNESVNRNDTPSSNWNSNAIPQRRKLITSILATTFFTATLPSSQQHNQQAANAMDNPLNLKGTFWETGQLYEKSNDQPADDADFLSILTDAAGALHSQTLTDAISAGKYGQTSRLLRGGLISEIRIRLAAYALIDEIPEDAEEYRASEAFRVFLRLLDVLDAEVEGASRGLGGDNGDPRFGILGRLGQVEESLKAFLKIVRDGLKD